MIKIADLAPLVAERVAADEAHRRDCTADRCDRCGRTGTAKAPEDPDAWRARVAADAVARIPAAYAGADLAAPWLVALVGRDAIARARDAAGQERAAFLGPPGAGKSSLAAAMFRARAASETSMPALRRYRWTSAHALAKARAVHPLGDGEAPAVEAALEASLLVVDELGGEDPRYASAVAEVLYERHAAARPTWVTTGVGSREIATRYGGGIARRVFEGAEVFRLGGQR